MKNRKEEMWKCKKIIENKKKGQETPPTYLNYFSQTSPKSLSYIQLTELS